MAALTEIPMEDLFSRARAGDEVAWKHLFEKCYPKVRRVVRRKMDRSMGSLYDSTDFASDVWSSLIAKFDRFQFDSIASFEAFLAKAAEEKVIDVHRKLHTLKRDKKRETRLDAQTADGTTLGAIVASSDPTPSQFAVAKDTLERVRSKLDNSAKEVLDMAVEGYSSDEIAKKTGWHVRTVQRCRKEVNDSWQYPGELES